MGGFHHASPLVDSVITCHIRSPIIPPGFRGGGKKKRRRIRVKILVYATIRGCSEIRFTRPSIVFQLSNCRIKRFPINHRGSALYGEEGEEGKKASPPRRRGLKPTFERIFSLKSGENSFPRFLLALEFSSSDQESRDNVDRAAV